MLQNYINSKSTSRLDDNFTNLSTETWTSAKSGTQKHNLLVESEISVWLAILNPAYLNKRIWYGYLNMSAIKRAQYYAINWISNFGFLKTLNTIKRKSLQFPRKKNSWFQKRTNSSISSENKTVTCRWANRHSINFEVAMFFGFKSPSNA